MTKTTEQVELCWCPLCNSASPESQARLREIASYGMARFMQLALKAGVNVSPEQQADIFASILDWDPAGAPGECDWMVHEHAMRALCYGAIVTGDGRLEAAMATAFLRATRDEPAGAVDCLGTLLERAEVPFTGWTIPIEPLLEPLRGRDDFQPVLDRLAVRAGVTATVRGAVRASHLGLRRSGSPTSPVDGPTWTRTHRRPSSTIARTGCSTSSTGSSSSCATPASPSA